MECYRVRVPPGTRLAGYTAAGRRVQILPGEYHVHRMRSKLHACGVHALRFVGAYGGQADIHLPLDERSDISRVLPPEVSAVGADSG